MTSTASPSGDQDPTDIKPARTAALDAGRAAAARRRRADSERCRQHVLDILAKMRRNRLPLSDAEITRRAEVNPQYLQRHRDLKAEAEAVRAHLASDRPRAAGAASARKEAALEVENHMLLEQNAALRRNLDEARAQLRALRVQELGARTRDGLGLPAARDSDMDELRKQRDAATAARQRTEADLTALRNVNQRLMAENSPLLEAATRHAPAG
ncbi:hypothetical protein OOK36_48055 [Streptomyces sp. NBC_00365]|uniref:hypothetical protein n=1 Tax=Streptomyces sp. NBC_00365 TaxID=2975726 RepID=UPI00224CB041|nr:hypothetical protein [Streptomyces sp. NBC_00365]MCX5096374.1 hypothetical protein [Streptomyces sp. NBC_00365]